MSFSVVQRPSLPYGLGVDDAPSSTTWAILGGALILGAVFFWSSLGAKRQYRGSTFKYNGVSPSPKRT